MKEPKRKSLERFHGLTLDGKDRHQLAEMKAGRKRLSSRQWRRVRILELLDQKWTMQDTADAAGTYPREVRRVARRYLSRGLDAALSEDPRPKPEKKFDARGEAAVVALTCSPPPPGRARWTVRLLAREAEASVPARWVESVVRAAVRVAVGEATAGVVSASAAGLAEGVIWTMILNQMKTAAAALAVLAAVAVGATVYAQNSGRNAPKEAALAGAPKRNPDQVESAEALAGPETPKPASARSEAEIRSDRPQSQCRRVASAGRPNADRASRTRRGRRWRVRPSRRTRTQKPKHRQP